MPIYEYQCTLCQHQLALLQKMSDPSIKICPHCNQPSLAKLVSHSSFQLKGTGWYVTDFKDKAPNTNTQKKANLEKQSDKESAQESDRKRSPQQETQQPTQTTPATDSTTPTSS